MKLNTYRKLVLLSLNLLILFHAYAWFVLKWDVIGHSDPRETYKLLATGALGAGAIIMIVAVLATMLGGRVFCGWFCHMGAWQEVATWLQAKVGIKRQILHSRLTVLLPFLMLLLWAINYRVPQTWEEQGFPTSVHWEASTTPIFESTFDGDSPFALLFELSIFLFGMQFFFGSKGVCRYLCPLSPVFKMADKVALFRLRAVNNDCDDCQECNRVCLMGIDVLGEIKQHGQVNDVQCIKCMTCVDACHTKTIGYTMKRPEALGVQTAAPKRAWLKRQAPVFVDIALTGMVITVFLLLPWEMIDKMILSGRSFMLWIPLVCFAGLLIVNFYRRFTAKPDDQRWASDRVPERMLRNKRAWRWNSFGRGW